MRFQSTIAILTAFSAPFAVAAPVPEDNVPPVPDNEVSTLGAQMGFYVCDGYGFSGYCQVFKVPFGQCTSLQTFGGGVSSAGPDPGNWCTLYENPGCTGRELQVYNPGFSDLRGPGYDNVAKSFNCAALW